MAEQVLVTSRRTPYMRGFLVTEYKLVSPALGGEPLVIPKANANLMTQYSADYDQSREIIRIRDLGDMVELTNISTTNSRRGFKEVVQIKFPRLPIQPGPNYVSTDLLIEALNNPLDGPRLMSLQGQPDGLIFRDPREGAAAPVEAVAGIKEDSFANKPGEPVAKSFTSGGLAHEDTEAKEHATALELLKQRQQDNLGFQAT